MISADMNYRSTLWNYGKHPSEVMPELLSFCDVITGDIDTVETYFGIKTPKDISVEKKFRSCHEELIKSLPALQVLAMSFRDVDEAHLPTYRGAAWINNEFVFTPVITIPQTIDRIGSGDAFMGGLLYGLLLKNAPQQVIDIAAACGVIKHSIEGDFTIISTEEINQFMKTGPVNKIIR